MLVPREAGDRGPGARLWNVTGGPGNNEGELGGAYLNVCMLELHMFM